jgi:osmotically-inducible protein OsmY
MPARVPDHWVKKLVMRHLYKREVDISRILVFCTSGVVTIMGELRHMRGHELDLKVELAEIENLIRQIDGVRDIINQVKVVEF